ncbi:hypothetical protein CBS14141_002122 [Malassezia furfur]|nr:hypothetical protein CBS14141_002122 [Malassezia furfur]
MRPPRSLQATLARLGMGVYQWRLLVLSGMGWAADNGIAIALPRIQYEWSIADRTIGLATSALFAGMTLGSIVWGSCADLYGRLYVFLRTLVVTAVLGAALSFAPTFGLVCVMSFGVGTGVGGSMPIDGTLFLESIPQSKHFWLTALSVFFSLGSVTGVFAVARMCPWSVHESPTFLVATDQLDDARSTLEQISTANGEDSTLNLDDVRDMDAAPSTSRGSDDPERTAMLGDDRASDRRGDSLDPSPSSFSFLPGALAERVTELAERSEPLFEAPNRRPVLLTWTLWALMSLAFTMFNAFYPLFLQRKLGQQADDVNEVHALYDYLWYAVSSVPGSLLGTALVESQLGRAKSLALALLVTSAAQLVFLASTSATAVVVAGMGVSLSATTAYAILYGFTPDVFPTSIRGTACAVASALGRITGIVAPMLAGALLQVRVELAVLTSVVLFALCACTALFLPSRTRAAAVHL